LKFSQGKQEVTLNFDEPNNGQNSPNVLTFIKEFQRGINFTKSKSQRILSRKSRVKVRSNFYYQKGEKKLRKNFDEPVNNQNPP